MKKWKKDDQGIVTIPFLLVLVIVLFFTLSFLMLAMTLVHVTVTQYMTYSSARKLSLAGENSATQLDATLDHYKKLRGQFFKSSAHRGNPGDWFKIQSELEKREQEESAQGSYPEDNNFRGRFYGVNVTFQTLALNLKIPFLIESDTNKINEAVRVSSFLGREPSKKECESFHEKRREEIKKLCNPPDCPDIKKPEGDNKGDNGC